MHEQQPSKCHSMPWPPWPAQCSCAADGDDSVRVTRCWTDERLSEDVESRRSPMPWPILMIHSAFNSETMAWTAHGRRPRFVAIGSFLNNSSQREYNNTHVECKTSTTPRLA